MKPPRVLIIAGSDSGGGAGIQADIKTVTMLGGFAMTAITAITAQNTLGVQAIHPVPPDIIRTQIRSVMEDLGADIIKIGMLGTAESMAAVVETLGRYAPTVPIILDPVMQAKGGAALLSPDAHTMLVNTLLPLASVLTPNIPEAEILSTLSITCISDMEAAAAALARLTDGAVLVKGGHLAGDELANVLHHQGKTDIFRSRRIESCHTHGTGCTLASALAVLLAEGLTLPEALPEAQSYVHQAILHAPGYGSGHGPMDHGWPLSSKKRAIPPRS